MKLLAYGQSDVVFFLCFLFFLHDGPLIVVRWVGNLSYCIYLLRVYEPQIKRGRGKSEVGFLFSVGSRSKASIKWHAGGWLVTYKMRVLEEYGVARYGEWVCWI